MNFLAHLHLSGKSDKLMVGNFIGDFVKGKDFSHFDDTIALGIQLHRAIDEYTDSHEVVSLSKDRLRGKYRHYSGVIVDMFYDHFLAINWKEFGREKLLDYSLECYETIEKFHDILPERVKYMLPFMKENNWLYNYSKVDGIQRALNGMSRRTTFASKMDEATRELKTHYDSFNKEFRTFYPDLVAFSKDWKKEHDLPN